VRDTLYLRGRIWWCLVTNPKGGRSLRRSTRCHDRVAARKRWLELERAVITQADRPPDSPTLAFVLDWRLSERETAGKKPGTLSMYGQKGRHLVRLLGADTLLSDIGAQQIDQFAAERLKEGAARTTVHKELVTLRGALKLARRYRQYPYALDEVMPEFAIEYVPKERALPLHEIALLLGTLPAKRSALVGLLIATAATYPSEIDRLRKTDIDLVAGYVRLRGTKRTTRDRRVPIVDFARPWVERAVAYMPFERWTNVRRDLHVACKRVEIEACSPNDLRRTMLTLLRAHGVEPSLLAVFAGHADSRMVERVYGRLAPEQLAKLLEQRLAFTTSAQRAKKMVKTSRKRTNAAD